MKYILASFALIAILSCAFAQDFEQCIGGYDSGCLAPVDVSNEYTTSITAKTSIAYQVTTVNAKTQLAADTTVVAAAADDDFDQIELQADIRSALLHPDGTTTIVVYIYATSLTSGRRYFVKKVTIELNEEETKKLAGGE